MPEIAGSIRLRSINKWKKRGGGKLVVEWGKQQLDVRRKRGRASEKERKRSLLHNAAMEKGTEGKVFRTCRPVY